MEVAQEFRVSERGKSALERYIRSFARDASEWVLWFCQSAFDLFFSSFFFFSCVLGSVVEVGVG